MVIQLLWDSRETGETWGDEVPLASWHQLVPRLERRITNNPDIRAVVLRNPSSPNGKCTPVSWAVLVYQRPLTSGHNRQRETASTCQLTHPPPFLHLAAPAQTLLQPWRGAQLWVARSADSLPAAESQVRRLSISVAIEASAASHWSVARAKQSAPR